MKKGVAFGNIVYGYEFRNGQLFIVEEEAKIVRIIFHKYLIEGKGAYTIANELKVMGVKVKRTGTTNWRTGTILDILRNVKYVGDLKQRITYTVDYLEHIKKFNEGEVEFIYIRDHHEAIIDRETFEATQRELERRSNMHKREKSKYSCRHTFSGKLVCEHCGASYVGGVGKKRADNTIRRSWRCATAVNYGKKHIVDDKEIGCDAERVDDKVLKESFLSVLKQVTTNKKQIQQDIDKVLKNVIERCKDQTDEVDYYMKQKEKVEKERSKLLDLCLKEIISDDEYKNKSMEITERINTLNDKIVKEESKARVRNDIDDIVLNAKKRVNEILNIKQFSENLCKELVDKVVIYNKKKFDFYIKGYTDPFNVDYKSDILYSQH